MKSTIVRVADLRQQVYENLKARITGGGFTPDHKFHEISLAEELGVSRTPVREALALLVRDGILVQAARGFRLPKFTATEISEITEIRLRLEPYAVRRVVERASRPALERLANLIRDEVRTHGEDDSYVEAHRRYRDALFAHLENRRLIEAIAHYEDTVHYIRIHTLKQPRWREISVRGALALADAIAKGDAEAAEREQAELLAHARDAFLVWCSDNA